MNVKLVFWLRLIDEFAEPVFDLVTYFLKALNIELNAYIGILFIIVILAVKLIIKKFDDSSK